MKAMDPDFIPYFIYSSKWPNSNRDLMLSELAKLYKIDIVIEHLQSRIVMINKKKIVISTLSDIRPIAAEYNTKVDKADYCPGYQTLYHKKTSTHQYGFKPGKSCTYIIYAKLPKNNRETVQGVMLIDFSKFMTESTGISYMLNYG